MLNSASPLAATQLIPWTKIDDIMQLAATDKHRSLPVTEKSLSLRKFAIQQSIQDVGGLFFGVAMSPHLHLLNNDPIGSTMPPGRQLSGSLVYTYVIDVTLVMVALVLSWNRVVRYSNPYINTLVMAKYPDHYLFEFHPRCTQLPCVDRQASLYRIITPASGERQAPGVPVFITVSLFLPLFRLLVKYAMADLILRECVPVTNVNGTHLVGIVHRLTSPCSNDLPRFKTEIFSGIRLLPLNISASNLNTKQIEQEARYA